MPTTDPADQPRSPDREPVDPARLRTDISLCLQLAPGRTARDNLAREAFHLIADTVVEHLVARGYQVTAPRPKPAGPGPDLIPWQPPRPDRS